MKIGTIVCLVALSGLAACADNTTAPMESETAPTLPQVAMSMSTATYTHFDFRADLENIRDAVLPGFVVASAADSLRGRLATLTAQLSLGDRAGAAETLVRARGGLTPSVSNSTDLGYIEMVFGNIDAALARN